MPVDQGTAPGYETAAGARICPLCEACCGLDASVQDGRLVKVVPRATDVFSHGYACPKGLALERIDGDPDRLTSPMVRIDGVLRPVGWDEAFAVIAERLPPLLAEDRNACAIYLGNPSGHNLDLGFYEAALVSAVRSRNLFSAATVDSMPRHLVNGMMYGTGFGVPVPDLERTSYLLVIGSNPMVSNGSLMSAPGIPGKLRDLKARGGRLAVVDPVRTRTAAMADRHLAIRPGADAHLLAAMITTLAGRGLIDTGTAGAHLEGLDELLAALAPFTPAAVAARCGLEPAAIEDLAIEFAAADGAAAHVRIGGSTQRFGATTNWLVDVLNIVTGNLDRPGGVMFAAAPGGAPNTRPADGRGWPHSRWTSRVRGFPERQGELPAACLAEEMEVPGPGQVRALISIAGNVARSLPHSARIEKALAGLDLLICLDGYLNETTRYADVILPPPRLVTRGHFDLTINQFATRNVARYSRPLSALRPGERSEREVLLRLASVARGDGDLPVEELDEAFARKAADRSDTLYGLEPGTAWAGIRHRRGAERLLELGLRTGPYGDLFGRRPGRLDLDAVENAPDGVDLGPLEPRLPEVLRTPSGRIELAPPDLVADLDRLEQDLAPEPPGTMLLIGRRQPRGMNSWLHNALPVNRNHPCTAQVSPASAQRLGAADGGLVRVASAVGEVEIPLEISDTVPDDLISIPHGWGHSADGTRQQIAVTTPGVNANLLNDDADLDPVSGTAVLTGQLVTVTAL
ncbi:molybdopterin-dependent oxidoreductase [Nakamurella sp. YIM 132087]|uniref:Molybdopterin-dependent oxidoreductase n=1 Tax=Nakamurella alba TaxID=2665158 RepID=A0A7K1FIG3_9ACTN|nr:molybdopterin-dependent oxidoreductase [Nakamurella alba]MTD13870.1 molybdopterin-dependent oxidoreductase [Nakamurella alba]